MNLHGYLARSTCTTGPRRRWTSQYMYFMTVLFEAIRPRAVARERGRRFEGSRTPRTRRASSSANALMSGHPPRTVRAARLSSIGSTQADWEALAADVATYGMYNQNLQAVPPTEFYRPINNSTSSIHDRVPRGDPQGGRSARLLPGTVHDEREPGVLPGRVRDRPGESSTPTRVATRPWIRACEAAL